MVKKLLISLMIVSVAFAGCKKKDDNGDGNKNYNTLKITSGEFSGTTYTFSPNLGFWAEAGTTAYYIHLVFGDTDNAIYIGSNIMSVLFYYKGDYTITFPSSDGQALEFGLNIDGTDYFFEVQNATLTLTDEPVHEQFTGHISGDFVDMGNASRTIHIEMDFRINMQPL